MKTDIQTQMKAEKPDDVLADLEAKRRLAKPDGSDAPDPTCPSCGGRGKHLVGYTGYGLAMFQQCPFCQGTGAKPMQPNASTKPHGENL